MLVNHCKVVLQAKFIFQNYFHLVTQGVNFVLKVALLTQCHLNIGLLLKQLKFKLRLPLHKMAYVRLTPLERIYTSVKRVNKACLFSKLHVFKLNFLYTASSFQCFLSQRLVFNFKHLDDLCCVRVANLDLRLDKHSPGIKVLWEYVWILVERWRLIHHLHPLSKIFCGCVFVLPLSVTSAIELISTTNVNRVVILGNFALVQDETWCVCPALVLFFELPDKPLKVLVLNYRDVIIRMRLLIINWCSLSVYEVYSVFFSAVPI